MAFDMVTLAKAPTRKIAAAGTVQRRATIIHVIVTVARESWRDGTNPTLWAYEGLFTATLRSGLCLGGMSWDAADRAARDIVGEALRQAGAKRPSWREAQREYTDQGVIRETRLRCAQCDGALPEGHKAFCSRRCYDAHKARLAYQADIEGNRKIQRMRRMRRQGAA